MTVNQYLYVNMSNLLLHVVIQLLDGVKAGFEPPVLLVLPKKILQLAPLLLVFLVTHIMNSVINILVMPQQNNQD